MMIKIITTIYFLLLVGIVILANNGGTRALISFGNGIPFFDKIAHFLLSGLLSFLVNLVAKAKTAKLWKIRYLLGSIIVLTVVTLEELSQLFLVGRTFDSGDILSSFLGIFIFGETAKLIYQRYLVKQ